MRICIPIHSFALGGVERTALRLAQSWQAEGEAVVVVLGRKDGAMRAQAPMLDYRTRPEPIPTARWETLWLIWCLWRYLRRESADVLFCPGNTYSIVCVAVRLLLGPSCPPIVATISNDLQRRTMPWPGRALYHLWLRFQAPYFVRIVALAPPAVDEIVRIMRAPRKAVAVIENPAISKGDLAVSRARRRHSGPGRRFVAVARLEPQKNLPLLLRAFAAGRRSGDTLAILGDGSLRPVLERQIARLSLAETVTLLGFVSDAPQRVADYDALLLSSDYEGLGNVVIEALARGVPVITTDCSSTTRFLMRAGGFGPSRHGWLVPVRDCDALAAAISAFDTRSFDCESALAMAERFTLEKASLSYRGLMHSLLGTEMHSEMPRDSAASPFHGCDRT